MILQNIFLSRKNSPNNCRKEVINNNTINIPGFIITSGFPINNKISGSFINYNVNGKSIINISGSSINNFFSKYNISHLEVSI